MSKWFYASGGKHVGPFDEAQMRDMINGRQIGPNDLVWREGMPQWVAAASVAELIPTAVAVVPALPLAPMAPLPDSGPMQLAYASPVVAEAPVVEDDLGPFLKIGSTFTLPGSIRWKGMSIASPKAFYLMKGSRVMSTAAYGVGGLAGAMLHRALSDGDDLRTCTVADLPEAVSGMLDRKRKKGQKDVIVLPRGAIRLLKAGGINNVVTAHVHADKFKMDRGLFSGGKVRRFLTQNGWMLNQEVVPTAAPIHGHGLGRTYEESEKRKPSSLKKAIYITAAILLLLIIIIANVLRA